MAKALDLRNVKKSFFPITFKDGKEIFVTMPTKRIFEELLSVDENSDENTEQLYSVLATALSKNKANKAITKEYLEKVLDIEDIGIVFKAYVEFVSESGNAKN